MDNKGQATKIYFPKPFDYHIEEGHDGPEALTLIEQKLNAFSGCIRQKPNWTTKVNDVKITSKWETEAKEAGITCHQFKYVIDQLRYFVEHRVMGGPGGVRPSPVNGVYESDVLIDFKLRDQLMAQAKVLEDVPEADRDYHPGSNNQVLNLVHPSMYCLIDGVSMLTTTPIPLGKSVGLEATRHVSFDKIYAARYPPPAAPYKHYQKLPIDDETWSKKYQWLPSDVQIDEKGTATFTSYINNLDYKQHEGLYDTLGQILSRFVPMFNTVLTDLLNPTGSVVVIPDDLYPECTDEYIADARAELLRKKALAEANGTGTDNEEQDEDDEVANADDDEIYQMTKQPIVPDIGTFVAPAAPKITYDLRGKKVQVIVKLANILLTPEKPEYDGGAWHVEGMENENIVASGIYYYESSNITESHLEFKNVVHEPPYEQNDNEGIEAVYGLRNEEALSQYLGSVITQQDRCIAFPNIFQHHVKNFKLTDPTKPGSRKILVFFLIDPTEPITSTANVVQQQGLLPKEHALIHRAQLMKERKFFITYTDKIYNRPFSLCEH